MRHLLALLITVAVALPACKEEAPPPPPEPTAPPEPSAEDIYKEIWTGAQPLKDPLTLDLARKEQALGALRSARSKHQMTSNGKEALSRVTAELKTMIIQAKESERWRYVMTLCEAYEILDPGNTLTRRYMEMAEKQASRPKINVKGFVEDQATGNTFVFLDAKLGDAPWQTLPPVREGEEFLDPPYTLRLLEIIGNNKGVRLEYLAIEGDVFDVPAP